MKTSLWQREGKELIGRAAARRDRAHRRRSRRARRWPQHRGRERNASHPPPPL